MKIATFNVNGIRSRLAHLLLWLERESPDIACLQELKSESHGFPMLDIRARGYEAIWHGQKSWNGVAILAKGAKPVEVARALPGDPADEHSRYIEADVGEVRIGCLYLPNGNPQPGPKFEYKLAWMERLIKHAKEIYALDQPVILAGDYNVVPTDFDIYDPKSWRKDALLQPQSREAYKRLLDQGWVDSLRHLHPDEKIFTFWDYFRKHWERNSGLRIDHLLVNPPAAELLEEANVDRWVRDLPSASDHAPTWIELAKPKAGASPRAAPKSATGSARSPRAKR
ncbi:MAG TPA: exodeoxyribonuclease III [Usitatibacter sp.]|nr:exodeoxyribonuclease III [Usitatibacter sp.]